MITLVLKLLAEIPHALADWAERFVIDQHQPYEMGHGFPPWCIACKSEAPCPTLLEAIERREARLRERSGS